MDVNGECETKYVINSEPSVDYSTVSNMVVTKVKNLDKCLTRNSFEQGLFAGLPHYQTEKVRDRPLLCSHVHEIDNEIMLTTKVHHEENTLCLVVLFYCHFICLILHV